MKAIASPFILLAVMAAIPDSALAWEKFNQGCDNCHDFFTTPDGWPANLHTVHSGDEYMDNACDLCHVDANRQCFLAQSKGTGANDGLGCLGCHGRQDGDGNLQGWGLMALHGSSKGCTMCHSNTGTPAPESTKPPYYGSADTRVTDPCNAAPAFAEDFSGDDKGLDNDGDGQLDEDDPDCKTEPIEDGGSETDGDDDAGTQADAGSEADDKTEADAGTDDKKDDGGCATTGSSTSWLAWLALLMVARTRRRR
jgi:uncharacterized protein (TIGR03382 family)